MTTLPSTPPAPPFPSRAIGLAHYAGRALLERALARHGVTFRQLVTLRPVALAEGPVDADGHVARTAAALKAEEADIRAAVRELNGLGLLVADGTRLRATDAGRSLQARATAEGDEIAARLYAGISEADLAVTGSVLATVTERADAELAALQERQHQG